MNDLSYNEIKELKYLLSKANQMYMDELNDFMELIKNTKLCIF